MATILVADDEPDVLMQLRQGLEAAGHDVVLASDGRMALARIAEREPHLVVIDLLMPVLAGLEVLEDLQRQMLETPVLVLLAGAESVDDGRRALAGGALGFAVKPVLVELLCASVAEMLDLRTDGDRAAYRELALHGLDDLR